jgi:hypothetical protein
MRQIYIASSWKNAKVANKLAEIFRTWGHCVYSFAEPSEGNHIFNWRDIPGNEELDGISCLQANDSKLAFRCDKYFLDWADTCVLYLPSGRDAHLEAGYIKGKGGQIFILGEFPKGEFSNMYHLANGLYRISDLPSLRSVFDLNPSTREVESWSRIY